MRSIFTGVLCLLSFYSFSQQSFDERFNKVSDDELKMKIYEKDTTAVAVYLDEYAERSYRYNEDAEDVEGILQYYAKIKILKNDGLEEGNIVIPYATLEDYGERILNIKAITHNVDGTSNLQPENILTEQVSGALFEKKLLLPNVKVGSVIEYQYTLISPVAKVIRPWIFQANIPKVYAEFNAKIPANYRYKRSFKGQLPLAINKAKVQKNCFEIRGLKDKADCEVVTYAMKDIPAFKKEEFALSYENYKARVEFHLVDFRSFRSIGWDSYRGMKNWEEFDKVFNSDVEKLEEILNKRLFKGYLPKEIIAIPSKLDRAKKVYEFIREHYTSSGELGGIWNNNLRKAFRKKRGNLVEINLSLMNALHAAEIHAEAILMSTRNHSIPTQNYPKIDDFNYMIVKTIIDGKEYFLDATNKSAPFGILPLRALNYAGRAIDFVAESYWQTIYPNPVNRLNTSITLNFAEDGSMKGKFVNMHTGHIALDRRTVNKDINTEKFLNTLETEHEGLEVVEYSVTNSDQPELPLKELFEFELDLEEINGKLFLDPFLFKIFPKNPFTLSERTYPVDFAYPRVYTTRFLVSLPENYEFENLPKDQTFSIGENKSICKFTTVAQDGNLNMTFTLMINEFHYVPDEYETLKSFFNQLVQIQKNTLITIKKKNS